MRPTTSSFRMILAGGDILVLALVTLVGFARHGELDSGLHMLSTFVPLCIAWALVAPWLGLYHPFITSDVRQFWRPALAALIAAPLAGWLRGFWLNTAVIPIFVLVLASVTALPMLLWRGIWAFAVQRQVQRG